MTCVTGANNELLFDGTYTYLVRRRGNQTARLGRQHDQPAGDAAGRGDTNITIYTWDNRNRLTSVTQYATYADYKRRIGPADAGQTVTLHLRRLQPLDRRDGHCRNGGQADGFVYDGTQIVMQFDESPTSSPSMKRGHY